MKKKTFPKFGNGKGVEKTIPKIREQEGNEKIHSHNSGKGIRGFHSWEWTGTGIPAHPCKTSRKKKWRGTSRDSFFLSKFCHPQSRFWEPKLKTWSRQIMLYTPIQCRQHAIWRSLGLTDVYRLWLDTVNPGTWAKKQQVQLVWEDSRHLLKRHLH